MLLGWLVLCEINGSDWCQWQRATCHAHYQIQVFSTVVCSWSAGQCSLSEVVLFCSYVRLAQCLICWFGPSLLVELTLRSSPRTTFACSPPVSRLISFHVLAAPSVAGQPDQQCWKRSGSNSEELIRPSQKSVQNRFVSKLFWTFTTFPSQGPEQDRLSLVWRGLLIWSRLNLRSAWSILTLDQECRRGRFLQGREGLRLGWRRGELRQMLRAQQSTRMMKMTRRFWLLNSRSSRRRGPNRFSLQRMICTPTLSLFLSLSLLLVLWRTRSPMFSLFFSLSLFSWYLLIKIKFLDIFWFRTPFLLILKKVHIYSKTHPLTRSKKYPPSHKCHINTQFLTIRYQIKKSPQSHANTLYDTLWHCHYTPKKTGLRRRPPAALRDFRIQVTFLLSFFIWNTQPNH